MLQLPSKAPKFTCAQIAEITRGSKASVHIKPKTDPLVAMVARADKLLDRYYDVVLIACEARDKLPKGRVGLVKARRDVLKVYRSLQKITAEIAACKPSSVKGAFAAVQYVGNRLWCDRPGMFSNQGRMPGKFGPLLRAANSILIEHFKEYRDVSSPN
jgi:hypothetical protein